MAKNVATRDCEPTPPTNMPRGGINMVKVKKLDKTSRKQLRAPLQSSSGIARVTDDELPGHKPGLQISLGGGGILGSELPA